MGCRSQRCLLVSCCACSPSHSPGNRWLTNTAQEVAHTPAVRCLARPLGGTCTSFRRDTHVVYARARADRGEERGWFDGNTSHRAAVAEESLDYKLWPEPQATTN
jgi:hypothetical protein